MALDWTRGARRAYGHGGSTLGAVMTEGLLSLRSVSKSYWRGAHELRVLTDISIEIAPGEFIAVWGKRGAGKTTLLKIAAGLEAPDGGAVRFAGRDLASMSESAHARLMREQVGWVRRAGPRSDLGMLDYVALPLLVEHGQRRARSRAYDALARVGMSECAAQRWDSLSDGERALTGIAHGIVRRPRLLLIDDPTANLGVREREDVNELLRSLTGDEGLAVLMTVPGMPAAMGTDEVKVLSGGRLLEQPREPAPQTNVIDFPSRERSA